MVEGHEDRFVGWYGGHPNPHGCYRGGLDALLVDVDDRLLNDLVDENIFAVLVVIEEATQCTSSLCEWCGHAHLSEAVLQGCFVLGFEFKFGKGECHTSRFQIGQCCDEIGRGYGFHIIRHREHEDHGHLRLVKWQINHLVPRQRVVRILETIHHVHEMSL